MIRRIQTLCAYRPGDAVCSKHIEIDEGRGRVFTPRRIKKLLRELGYCHFRRITVIERRA